jgi:hypothetical protein
MHDKILIEIDRNAFIKSFIFLTNLKICMEAQKTPKAKIILNNKEQSWSYHSTISQDIPYSQSSQTEFYWHETGHIGQCNRINITQINPHIG